MAAKSSFWVNRKLEVRPGRNEDIKILPFVDLPSALAWAHGGRLWPV